MDAVFVFSPLEGLSSFGIRNNIKETTVDNFILLLITAAISMPYLVIFQLYQTLQYQEFNTKVPRKNFKGHRSSHKLDVVNFTRRVSGGEGIIAYHKLHAIF